MNSMKALLPERRERPVSALWWRISLVFWSIACLCLLPAPAASQPDGPKDTGVRISGATTVQPIVEQSYQDFYAKLLTIVTLFFENRLERGRATLMELEESHVFIYGKLKTIMSTATGEGCVPCFSQ